ncbi:MAG: hypothetical protein GZ091_02720 [Paludibacter sp.]|nr:hypothetical protein [Paludibacter sp.]
MLRKFILISFLFAFQFVIANDVVSDLFSSHNLKMVYRVNNYNPDLFNKLIGTNKLNANLQQNELQHIITKNAEWEITSKLIPSSDNKDMADVEVSFRLTKGNEQNASVSVDFEFNNWSKENYVMMPAAVCNGNRFESRRIAYSPKLNDIRDIGPDKPIIISDVPRLNIKNGPSRIQERSGGMALPAVSFHSPTLNQGALIITKQANAWGDYGINVEETASKKGLITIMSPLVRERYKYEICDNQVASTDTPANFKVGDEVKFVFRVYLFHSSGIQTVFDQYFAARKDLCESVHVTPLYTFSECYNTIENKFNAQNFVPEWGYYAIGMRENFLQDWQIGWTGGMISTYPLLFSNNKKTIDNVVSNFNWLFPNGISPSGFFWDSGEKGNKWYGGDIRKPLSVNWHLIRKSGDALYYIIKQFDLMKKKNITVQPEWEKGTRGVADAFVRLWQKWGQFGNFVDSRTGDVIVGGSTSGAVVPGALVLAAKYFNNDLYLEVAKSSAQKMYDDYISKGISCGGPGDAMQNPDSESWYAMVESFALLYETTGNKKWLQYAEETAAQFSIWVMSYNYDFPESCLFGKLNMQTTGSVFANTQNRHGSPGICTHSGLALLRLYRATNNPKYLELLKEITQTIPQYMSHSTRPIAGMAPGWINERVSTTDWLEGIGEIKPGSTWAETAMLLTAVELPGVYVDAELNKTIDFECVKSEIISITKKSVKIKLTNPTKFEAKTVMLVENKQNKSVSWKENKLLNLPKYTLKPSETKIIIIKY